ncbi:MAG: hypothetical protein UZ14_CFX002001164 [Chloroflexi bacterium OLB14]|nr:MAG: hypothetical protein UZ14_CFX002001164 [Chloroflexi bacterium OLB14]
MNVKFTGIVREIKDWNTNQKGEALPPEKVTSQILFLDRETGGDISLTYPAGHGLKVGQDVTVDVVVKSSIRNFRLTLYVQPVAKSK